MSDRLMRVALILLCALLLIAALGERSLPMFGGDRLLAARTMKCLFTLFGGLAFAFVQPAVWQWFARALQTLIRRGGSEKPLAKAILSPAFVPFIYRWACAMGITFGLAALALSFWLWHSGSP